MSMRTAKRPIVSIAVFTIFTLALFGIGWHRLDIDTDVMKALPTDDPVIADALAIFNAHPIQDQLTIDIGLKPPDTDRLAVYAEYTEAALRESGLFAQVGMAGFEEAGLELVSHMLDHMPLLFSGKDLAEGVTPRLSPAFISERLRGIQIQLAGMEGIGQLAFFEQDPLGLRELVLSRLRHLAPSDQVQYIAGRLFSADGAHVMVMARPRVPGTDTGFARRLAATLKTIETGVIERLGGDGVTFTPMGAYRAALDNETIIRKDVQKAITLATVGIAILLLITFPRPYIGLIALLPAVWGACIAFFIYSLFYDAISIMVLGFGGAILSITVDHGITYLLFADQPEKTFGRESAREARAVGLLAVLTTAGAFFALAFSGFPMLSQLGTFTALGIISSFLTIHTVLPKIIPELPAAKARTLPLQRLADLLMQTGRPGAIAAIMATVGLMWFAWPQFNVNLSAMNTVSPATQAAERLFMTVWGDTFSRTFLMMQAPSLEALQDKNDALMAELRGHGNADGEFSGFIPSMVFPGRQAASRNAAAWSVFWDDRRIAAVSETLVREAAAIGFSTQAFKPFLHKLTATQSLAAVPIPPSLYQLMGISEASGNGSWNQFLTFSTPPSKEISLASPLKPYGRVFEPTAFSRHFGGLLFATFLKMAAMVVISVVGLLAIFFLDIRLTIISLAPVAFAMVCTLGILNLIGHPLDIPALMLAIIVFGMGIDYSLLLVSAYQRYRDIAHPYFQIVRLAVLMAAISTLIGFGVLGTATHGMLRSAGMMSVIGISSALAGAFLLLPPLLSWHFSRQPQPTGGILTKRVLARYAHMEAYPRMFARFKLRLDPLFSEIMGLLPEAAGIHSVIDIGAGYGVPGCLAAETYPRAHIYGIEPDPGRASVAKRALGNRGTIVVGAAPMLPPEGAQADLVMMLDMVHYLSEVDLAETANRIFNVMAPGAPLIVRATIPPPGKKTLAYRLENFRLALAGITPVFRDPDVLVGLFGRAGFTNDRSLTSGTAGDLVWLRFYKSGKAAAV